MLGVELVKDHKTLEPATEQTAALFEKAKDYGVLIGKGGLYGNILRIKPPMCITKEDVDFFIDVWIFASPLLSPYLGPGQIVQRNLSNFETINNQQ